MMNVSTLTVGNLFGASLFMLAGIYQMTPLKNSCLHYCRNPIELLSNKKIFDNLGSFYIGIKHGIFCVGCCWPLMFLLFYSGVMNILWIAGLSFYILIEKYIVSGKKLNFLTGVILILFGFRIFSIYLF
jgi:predicted metal-binding membrane protein